MQFKRLLLLVALIGFAGGWAVIDSSAGPVLACIGGENWASIGYNNNTEAGNVEGCCDDDMRAGGWNPDDASDWNSTRTDLSDIGGFTLSSATLSSHTDLDVKLSCYDATACPTTSGVINSTQGNNVWLFGAYEPDIDDCECRDDCEGSS